MNTKRFLLLVWLLGLFLLTGCGSGPRTINVDDSSNGQQPWEMAPGEILEIHLKSDPINGYSWQVEKINPLYLEASKEVQYTPEGASCCGRHPGTYLQGPEIGDYAFGIDL